MKYKVKHEKSNLTFMTSTLILCFITCIFWLILKEYIYFGVYLVITLLIAYFYYFIIYILNKNFFIIRLGFINIKFNYKKIKKIEKLESGLKIYFEKIKITVYPHNKDIFYVNIKDKMKGK